MNHPVRYRWTDRWADGQMDVWMDGWNAPSVYMIVRFFPALQFCSKQNKHDFFEKPPVNDMDMFILCEILGCLFLFPADYC